MTTPAPEVPPETASHITKQEPTVELRPAEQHELEDLKRRLQEAFTQSAVAEFGQDDGEPIPSDSEINASFSAPQAEVLQILWQGTSVGGAVVTIHEGGARGVLDFFFLDGSSQGAGLGYAAWCAIEKRYPTVRLWETATPYFEKRNIHFYVNKCGFHIVEFFHPGHPDPHHPADHGDVPDYMFRFEKAI
ncbi:MAG: GNAT family N-acetyltransferase [Actinomycetaceae bacterium]|nr:GNAT family N-acetyltransferase [Actinomycetaceae bacterium]